MTGLGIIDTDLCLYARSMTQADVDASYHLLGSPTYKARPGSVVDLELAGIVDSINCWVSAHPWLAAGILGLAYLGFRRK